MSFPLKIRLVPLVLTLALLPFAFHHHQAAQAKSKIQNVPVLKPRMCGWRPSRSRLPTSPSPTSAGGGIPNGCPATSGCKSPWTRTKIDKELSGDGALLTYDFNAPSQAGYEVWNRIGYEFVRSPFQWRIDGARGRP